MFEVRAKVVHVTDGDTFVADLDVWLRWTMRAPVRIVGINAPEMRGGTPETRAAAEAAKEWLRARLAAVPVVMAKVVGEDHFGRVLAEVFVNGESIGDEMIELGLAAPYRSATG